MMAQTNDVKHLLVIQTFPRWMTHLATDLELVQNALDDGERVTVLDTDFEFTAVDFKVPRARLSRKFTRAMVERGYARIEGRFERGRLEADEARVEQLTQDYLRRASTAEALRDLEHDGWDIGYAVLSSLVSRRRDPDPDVTEEHELIRHFLRGALYCYEGTLRAIDRINPDTVVVFNGRFATVRGVFRAAQRRGVECLLHDRGSDNDHYEIFRNRLPHDRGLFRERLEAALASAPDRETVERIGHQFYREREAGIKQAGLSFTAHQKRGSLPDGWNEKRRNVVIFNSSEDEFVAIGKEWVNPLYGRQMTGLERLAESFRGRDDVMLWIRVHPNLARVDNDDVDKIGRLGERYENLVVIPASSPVSTYDLMKATDTVVTFGSSVGIEASYWGKPSICLGLSFYAGMDAVYEPASHEEVVSLIEARDLPPKDRGPALDYGYFLKTHGIEFRYYRARDRWNGTFKGVDLAKDPVSNLYFWLRKQGRRVKVLLKQKTLS